MENNVKWNKIHWLVYNALLKYNVNPKSWLECEL